MDHLEEFRKRIIISSAVILIAAGFCYTYAYRILKILTKPAGKITLVYLSPLEPFMVKFKIAIWAGVFVAMPILIYQVLAFIAPALKSKEKKYVYPAVFFLFLLFILGVVFGYNFIMPVGISWLFGQAGDALKANLTASSYINFAALFLFAFGISFETPLVILLLVKLRVVTPRALRENWRIAYLGILLFSAIATPDWSPVTMIVMAIPMIILYEISVLLSRVI
jgi:sec-independent protein translocase protein TatC